MNIKKEKKKIAKEVLEKILDIYPYTDISDDVEVIFGVIDSVTITLKGYEIIDSKTNEVIKFDLKDIKEFYILDNDYIVILYKTLLFMYELV